MKILHIPSNIDTFTGIILFSEVLKDDYLYNHQLSIVEDVEDSKDLQMIRLYEHLPDITTVSDRWCMLKTIFIFRNNF